MLAYCNSGHFVIVFIICASWLDLLFFLSKPRLLRTKQHFLSREKAEQLTRRNHAVHLQTDRHVQTDRHLRHRHCPGPSHASRHWGFSVTENHRWVGGWVLSQTRGVGRWPIAIQHRHVEHVGHAETYRAQLFNKLSSDDKEQKQDR